MPLTAELIETEIAKVLRVPQLPSQELLEVAIRHEWLPISMQNLIINAGPGRPLPTKLSRSYLKMVAALCDGYSRDYSRSPKS